MNTYEQWIAFYTILRREVLRFLRVWTQTLLPPVITMSLYFVIFGKLVGSQINNIGEFTYMQFIAPGLVMMSIVTNSYMNSSFSFFLLKFQKNIEELLVSPAPNHIIILGYTMGGIARGLCTGLIVMLVSLFFTEIHIHNVFFIALFAILTAAVFSLGGLANGIMAKKFDDVNIVPTFVLTPLTYLGGVFFSVEQLSSHWQMLSHFNPILYMVNGFRFGFLGRCDVDLKLAVVMLSILTLGLYGLNYSLLKSGKGVKS